MVEMAASMDAVAVLERVAIQVRLIIQFTDLMNDYRPF